MIKDMLAELQKNLKDWISNSMLEEVFDVLTTRLAPDALIYNDIIIVKVKFQALKREKTLALEERRLLNVTQNQITDALLKLIDQIEESDLINNSTTAVPIHYYHQHTCDRVEQSDCFRAFYNQKKEQKKHYYYIFGLDMQSHIGLFKRLAYDLEGRLEDFLNPNLETTKKSLKLELTFETSNNLDFYKENVLKSLFAACSISVDEQAPLLEKKLTDVLTHSPSIQGLGADDFVSIFMSISEWDWDAEVTPNIVRWFIQSFCGDDLPATSPTFVFFFAIIYEEDDSEVEKEIRATIDGSTNVEALPELNMVELRDIKKWFAKYRLLADSSRERKALIEKHFGKEKEFYMEDVEIEFQKIIDAYNS